MPTQRGRPSVAQLKKEMKRHTDLELKLFEVLFSRKPGKATDVYESLWDYAETEEGAGKFEMEDEELFYDE